LKGAVYLRTTYCSPLSPEEAGSEEEKETEADTPTDDSDGSKATTGIEIVLKGPAARDSADGIPLSDAAAPQEGEPCWFSCSAARGPDTSVELQVQDQDPVEEEDEGDDDPSQSDEEPEDVLDPEVEGPFVPLLIISALTVAFAHGANDVGNAVGPLAIIYQIHNEGVIDASPDIPLWALCMGAAGFVVGIVLLGSRTISTVGSNITALTPSRSYATQMGAAVAVLASSVLGLPVSTSHCLIGSIVGVGFAQQCTGQKSRMDLSVLKRIVMTWILTIPAAMLVAFLVYAPLESSFDA